MGLLETLGLKKLKVGMASGAANAAPVAGNPQAVADPEAARYAAARDAVTKLRDELKQHPQKARIAAGIATVDTLLAQAKGEADKAQFTKALTTLAAARKACIDAKALADGHAVYVQRRAIAQEIIYACRGTFGNYEATIDGLQADLVAADAMANANPPNYSAAIAKVEAVEAKLAKDIKSVFLDSATTDIAAFKAAAAKGSVKTFFDADIAAIDALAAQAQASFAAKAYAKTVLTSRQVSEKLFTGNRLAARRAKYDAQRPAARTALDGLKGLGLPQADLDALEAQLRAADAMAEKDASRYEDGVIELGKIIAVCTALGPVAAATKAYGTERAAADTAFAALRKHAAAARLGDQIAGVQAQLESATRLVAKLPPGAQALSTWESARTVVARAMADIGVARGLADSLGPVAAAQAAAAGAKDIGAVRKAIAAVRAQADAAQKQPFADQAKGEFQRYAVAINEADAQAADGKVEPASQALQRAADALMEARSVQVDHGAFDTLRKKLGDRLAALLAGPNAADLKPRIDVVASAVAAADASAKRNDHQDAMAALRTGEDAATQAEADAKARAAYDVRAQRLAADAKKGSDAGMQKAVGDLLKAAAVQAKAFDFAAAGKTLDEAVARIAGADVSRLAKTDPTNPALVAGAEKMKAAGGEKQIDALVEQLPDSVPFAVVAALAKVRFGIELSSDAGGQAVKSGKRIFAMMAKVPQDVIANPSLKKVQRKREFDQDGNDTSGGLYDSSQDAIVMNGRPKLTDQGFGKDIANQLPADVEEDCKPEDDKPLDYFDFATLHEVGHALDDAMNFMNSRGAGAAYGEWKTHGGDVEPIAAQVAAWASYDKTAAQTQYIADLILGKKPTAPEPENAADKPAWDAGLAKVTDWFGKATSATVGAGGIWWDQSACTVITMKDGRIYHEAYPKTWVSYKAAARKQAITGYQFRAPGEWFAELYAAYRSDKLKKSHPARDWLKTLKS
jgi:hypothetical protein